MRTFIRIACISLMPWFAVVEGPNGGLLGQEPAAVSIPKISPPEVSGGRQEIPLPETVDDIDVGGGGRYLALHFKALRKIGVFDINQLKITGYVSATDADTKFAAGATKMIVVSGDSGVVARWDLATLRAELTQTIDLGGPAGQALLGSASAGPAIVSGSSDRHGAPASLVDMNTLGVTPFASSNIRRGFGARANVRIAANGSVIGLWESGVSPSGLQSYVKSGDNWTGYYEHDSVGAIVPSPDGRLLYTGGGIFTNQLRRFGAVKPSTSWGYSIPAVHGPYYVTVDAGDFRDQQKKAEKVYLKLEGDDRPLVEIPNLDPVFNTNDRFARESLTIDKRLFLIPDANIVVQLADTKQKLVVVSFDIEKALKSSEVDYLIISSRPPLALKAGGQFKYQIETKSKAGGVKYSLDSGPAGMTISATGLLTWSTTAQSPAKSNVIVSVADSSEQQIFHTFELTVHGGDVSVNDGMATAASSSGTPKPVAATPSELKAERTELKLPGTAADVTVGGNGRLLFFHLRSLKRIAILDLSQGKIAGYFPANDDDTKFVAGATRALVFSATQGVVTRYRLDTLERELTVAIPFPDPIQFVGMGGGSEGPVLLRTSRGTGQLDSCSFHFLDVATMKPINVSWPNGHQPHSVYRDQNYIQVSTNGEAFVVAGIGVLRLNGSSVQGAGNGSELAGLPSADGRFFLTGRLFNSDLQPMGDASTTYGVAIPSVTGSYFLSFTNQSHIPTRAAPEKQSGKLYMFGDNRPLVTIQDLQIGGTAYPHYGNPLTMQKRLFFVPEAQVIATLLPSNDRVELRRFNVDEALEASGVDFLLVASQPPPHGEIGKLYSYTMQVKSKKGGVKFSLDSAPEGMKVSADGKITWTVPPTAAQDDYKVIVTVSDASGQSVFHTFSVGIPEVKEKLAAQQRQREEQMRLAQEETQRKLLAERQKALAEQQKALAEQMAAKEQARARAVQSAEKEIAASEKFRASMRTWTDSTGQHKIVARFLEIVNKNAVLVELENGEKRSVPLSRLSGEDIYEAVKSDLLRQGITPAKDSADSPFQPPP